MVDKVAIEDLDPTVLESRSHRIPAMKDGVTVFLTVEQILGLAGKADVGLGNANNTSDANKPISSAQAAALAKRLRVDDAQVFSAEERVQALTNLAIADGWAVQPIGVPIGVLDNLEPTLIPPTDDERFRYVKMTAGETGTGQYNDSVLTSENVSGTAPLVAATAVINLSGSPINGETINLINTERRQLRAGSAGSTQNDQMQQITGELGGLSIRGSGSESGVFGVIRAANAGVAATENSVAQINFDSANSPNARTGNETRSKNIGVTYYMRIK